jgi:two-component system NtrC family sensor kinase
MTQRIVTTLNQQDVLESTLEATLKTISQADWATIHYRPTEESEIISESLQSSKRKKTATKIDQALLEEVMQQRSPSYLPEYAPSPKATPHSLLILPMLLANTVTGTLSIASRRTHAFSDDQQQLLAILANQAAIALQNAQLYAEARRIDGLEALRDVSKSIITTLDLTQVLELVVSSAASTIPATARSALYLLSQPDGEFSLKASSNRPGSQSAEGIDEALDRVIDQATKQRAIAYETDVRGQDSVWSLLAAPLITGDNILGAICLESPHADAFSDDDRVLLSAFADQASIAIQNASLFQDLSSAYVDLASSREEILRSRNVLQALFDGITDGLYIVDREMEIIAVNQAEAQRLTLSPDELQGRVCDESLWEEAAEKLRQMIQLALDTEAEQSWPSQADAPNRGPFTNQNIHVYPILSTSGPAQRAIVFAHDVSEMRQLQASLFRSANLAAIGQLAASIAHEINNPLTVVTGNAQLLQMEIDESDSNYELSNRIRESGARMQRIVQNLLDFSSQETYQFDWIEVEETIEDALALIAHPLRKANIQVKKDLTGVPLICASANHLKLIWMNLLLNARDAIHQRDGEGEIRIGAESTSDTLSILITDDGVGIPAEHFEHLFRPFFTTKPPGKGLGLGLYTCRAIVTRHQGKIHIESQPDQGTIVRVSLPIQHTPDDTQQPE